jgi:hypothetical protein
MELDTVQTPVSIMPRIIVSFPEWQDIVAMACRSAAPVARLELTSIHHDRRHDCGLWIRALELTKDHESSDRFSIRLDILLDAGKKACLVEPTDPLSSADIANWFIRFSLNATTCFDCGAPLSITPDHLCAHCAFEHMKLQYCQDDSNKCALCQELAFSRLACGHGVHNKCYREFSRMQSSHRCPVCRTPLVDQDKTNFVSNLLE